MSSPAADLDLDAILDRAATAPAQVALDVVQLVTAVRERDAECERLRAAVLRGWVVMETCATTREPDVCAGERMTVCDELPEHLWCYAQAFVRFRHRRRSTGTVYPTCRVVPGSIVAPAERSDAE